ncbi:hypothetical protein RND81_10G235400 [Saponaria officinalis]|uniref:Uncharacterized protein n=1 Tax=Saponaria officinalis TaxID=3572 RepID=A0AAW1I5Q2_SAPOF
MSIYRFHSLFGSFKAQIPVTSPATQAFSRRIVLHYYLSYLDNNMLLGPAVGGGGVFVFTQAPALIC